MPKTKSPRFPVQPVIRDPHGTYRFKENRLVRAFYEAAFEGRKLDLNMVASMHFTKAERVQFAQLIGYSVSGWADLSYVSDKDYERAQKEVAKMEAREREEEK